MTKAIKNTLSIEGIRLYIFPESYSLTWNGRTSLDHLFRTEEHLLEKYSELTGNRVSAFAFPKEIAYFTPKDYTELKLESRVDAFVEHPNFLKESYREKVIHARITNPLFTLHADIYDKLNLEKEGKITINLKTINLKINPIIEDVVEFYEQTGSDVKRMFSDKHKKKIISAINKAVNKKWATFQKESY